MSKPCFWIFILKNILVPQIFKFFTENNILFYDNPIKILLKHQEIIKNKFFMNKINKAF